MSLLSFASAKGSPGVSHAVAELARLWGRDAVVADLDPAGGDVVLLQRDASGEPLLPDTGLVSLGAALRGGKSAELGEHLQTTIDGTRTLVGVSTPAQVHALGPVWGQIATSLAAQRGDVLADLGRFTPGSPVVPIIESSAALVLVARDDLPSLAHLRERLQGLREPLNLGRLGGKPVGVALVGDPRNARAVGDMVRLFAAADLSVEGLGMIADDPRSVATWWALSPRQRARSVYQRSLVDVAERLRGLVGSAPSLGAAPVEEA